MTMRTAAKRLGLTAASAVVALAATLWTLDRLLPPDLSRYRDSGTLVTDRVGSELRILPASGGVWRLAAAPENVDPAYVELLLAYEDRRFFRHIGVDPLA
ncbi:MAG: penicillin-binding protein 1C, partial [Proteobacteria bacterium]|nr:penicillin-binding protein 1C [Pseudomonadota bacterium]